MRTLFATYVLASALLGISCARAPAPLPTIGLGYWYWHAPLELRPEQGQRLARAMVARLYVHAATIGTDGERYQNQFRQRYEAPPQLHPSLILVVRLDPSLADHLQPRRMEPLADQIAQEVSVQRAEAVAKGWRVEGVQIDFDCPTSKLRFYGQLLDFVRPLMPGELSITGLSTWLDDPAYEELARRVDFVAMQAFEPKVPSEPYGEGGVGDESLLKSTLAKLDEKQLPYLIGVPGHSQAFLYQGREVTAIPLASIPSIEASESWTRETTIQRPGEIVIGYRQESDRLVFHIVDAPRLIRTLEMLTQNPSRFRVGTVIFRMPEEKESRVVPLESVAASIGEDPLRVSFGLEGAPSNSPWARIEGRPSSSVGARRVLRLRNSGNVPPSLASPIIVRVTGRPGDFLDSAAGDGSLPAPTAAGKRSTLARADAVTFRLATVPLNEAITVGTIETVPGLSPKVTVEWADPDGRSRQQVVELPVAGP